MRITSMPDIPAPTGVEGINHLDKNEPLKPVPSTVTEEPKVEGDQLSSKYADFAKKEKLFRSKVQAREDELRKREEALKAKEAEYGTNYIQKSKIPELFQTDSQKALRELGLSGDTLTNALLNQPSPQDLKIQQLESKLAALEGVPDQTKTLLEQRDKQAYDAAVNQIRVDVKDLITEDPSYEVIKSAQLEEDVVDKIIKTHEENGTILNLNQAAKIVEEEAFEKIIECFQIPKIKNKIQELLASEVKPPETLTTSSKPAPAKTLTHSQVSPAQRPMSPRERAILAFEGKLT